jgi:hypothetical protein
MISEKFLKYGSGTLLKFTGKSYGSKTHEQNIESERQKENNRDIRIATNSNSATEFLRISESR